jgi:protein O-mannosyl-transferase
VAVQTKKHSKGRAAPGVPSTVLTKSPAAADSSAQPLGAATSLWLLPALLVAVIVVYYPAWHGTRLWDDDAHLTSLALRSWNGLWRIWFELGATQQYYPIVHSAFWLQWHLWGDAFLGYHLVNIILHGVSSFLLVIILRRLNVPGAVVAGVLFALHPVQAESVAWITELKNVLSGTFYLAAALAYLQYDADRAPRHYILSFWLFTLALLSKTVTATLPLALVVVFWWKQGALSWVRDGRPLVPFVALGAMAGVLTACVESTFIGAKGSDFVLTPIERCLVAGRALLFYVGKIAWPTNLTFIYPRWTVSEDVWWQYLFPIVAVATFAALWQCRTRTRAPFAAAAFFVVTLGPALGFVDVYPFRYSFVADHFQYLATIGVIVPTAAVLVIGLRRQAPWTWAKAEAILCLVLAVPLGWLTTIQAAKYVNAEQLYATTLQQNPSCWLCQENLGVIALHRTPPQREEAMSRFREALRINPSEPQVHQNLGTALMEAGRLQEAVEEQRLAIRFAPGYAEAYGNLGAALQKLGRLGEAADAYRVALDIKPGLTDARMNLSVVLHQLNRKDEAATELREATKAQEAQAAAAPAAYVQLGDAAAAVGELSQAAEHYQQALRLGADSPATRSKLAFALSKSGRLEEAATQLRQLVRLMPADGSAHADLAGVLLAERHFDAAIAEFETALRLRPDVATVHNDFGVALATVGRRNDAARQFQEALRLQPDFAAARANLAKALSR